MSVRKKQLTPPGSGLSADEQQCAANVDAVQQRIKIETKRLVQELEIHQIELEMQNEALQQAQEEIEFSRDALAELYDFAPAGYFSFNQHGLILTANLAGAQMFGLERQSLLNKSMSQLIADADGRTLFSEHCADVLRRRSKDACEIWLCRSDGAKFFARLRSTATDPIAERHDVIRTIIVDVTEQKQLEITLQTSQAELGSLVKEKTHDLTLANEHLVQEIAARTKVEESLRAALKEIKLLKDRLLAENTYLKYEIAQEYNFGEIIGKSSAISRVFGEIDQVAPLDTTVLLLGETGSGKGVVARAIHARSGRKNRAMVTVNCTALPANLIESELFGREKGAFTGASARQLGRFDLADGGTIFLDEIGEMPLELQCKLLRVIQDGEFERLGSPRTIKVDVRIIAASNRVLEEEVRKGNFREDLFYRLNVFPITIPPLRARKEDIALLAQFFVAKFNKKIGKQIDRISTNTLEKLVAYDWPGNVRELESIIERAVITGIGSSLQVLCPLISSVKSDETKAQDVHSLAGIEHDHIVHVLRSTNWRVEGKNGAANILGMNPSTLRARMRKLGIHRSVR